MTTPQTPIINAGERYVNGLATTTSSTTTLTIAPGAARDSTNINDIILNNSAIISLAKIGANGLDTGPLAPDVFYAIYLIGDSTRYLPTAGLASLNATSPQLPLGYDMFRRIGWMRTSVISQVTPMFQYGDGQNRMYYYATPMLAFSGSSTTFFQTTLAASVPVSNLINSTEILFKIQYQSTAAPDVADFSPTNNGIALSSYSNGAIATTIDSIWLPASIVAGAPTIYWRSTTNTDVVTLDTIGFKDYL